MSLRVLHVGCGTDPLPDWLRSNPIEETRLDIDRRVEPDVIAPMTAMGDIGPFDVVYSSHALEHVVPAQVHFALKEMHRVLDDGGKVIVIVPDLEDVKPTTDVLFESPAGPMCGLDLIYGWHGFTASNPLMCHKSGFIKTTLADCMKEAGFFDVEVKRLEHYQLLGTGMK